MRISPLFSHINSNNNANENNSICNVKSKSKSKGNKRITKDESSHCNISIVKFKTRLLNQFLYHQQLNILNDLKVSQPKTSTNKLFKLHSNQFSLNCNSVNKGIKFPSSFS